MDRLQSMRVFAKVAEQGSFVRAAENLEISNAVATRFIADLEAHLGTRLLNRSTRKLSLTEAGQAYLERVRHILPEIDDAEALVSLETKRPTGTLALYSVSGFGQTQLGKILPGYAKAYPEVVLDITLSDRPVDLVEEGMDVGFFSSLQKIDASMVVRKLGVSRAILCASAEYIEKHGAPQTPDELSSHICLNFSHEHLRHYWHLETEDGMRDVAIISRVVSNNSTLLRDFALAGMGIVMRPSFSLGDDLRSGRLQRVLPNHRAGEIAISLAYSSRRQMSAKVRSFVDYISEMFPHPEADAWL
ncbi:LysR family transcriptional regulator [Herbaspirillum lusitanum]|uniref:LysR family transcriptional regulator n=1 Tax=Herbaspirillum lusitanum TaxID=213312 RepID=A0ABW9A9G4_9BURK